MPLTLTSMTRSQSSSSSQRERQVLGDAGVVDQDIDAAPLASIRFDHRLGAGPVEDRDAKPRLRRPAPARGGRLPRPASSRA